MHVFDTLIPRLLVHRLTNSQFNVESKLSEIVSGIKMEWSELGIWKLFKGSHFLMWISELSTMTKAFICKPSFNNLDVYSNFCQHNTKLSERKAFTNHHALIRYYNSFLNSIFQKRLIKF